ncbi:MAG: hypothetical protein U0694_05075 [Anaerolineae bacterium]
MQKISRLLTHYLSLIARCSLLIAAIAACSTPPSPTPTLVPSLTPSPIPTLQPSPSDEPTFIQNIIIVTATPDPLLTPTETPLVVQIEPLTADGIAPPFAISLPPDWEAYYTNYILRDVGGLLALPLTVYRGPVTGGTGYIAVLWAFPNLSGANPLQPDASQVDLFADGSRLLRLAVLEQGCNIGTDLQRQYTVGGQTAVGTQFSAVTCPETADTRGWFAGLQVNDLSFLFYVYTDPITAIDPSRAGLQAVLDSVRFISAAEMQATALSIPTAQATQLVPTATP